MRTVFAKGIIMTVTYIVDALHAYIANKINNIQHLYVYT